MAYYHIGIITRVKTKFGLMPSKVLIKQQKIPSTAILKSKYLKGKIGDPPFKLIN